MMSSEEGTSRSIGNALRKRSRRSSILKTRDVLADIDPNNTLDEEEDMTVRRKSRRVSFCDTYQVKEFAKESPRHWLKNAEDGANENRAAPLTDCNEPGSDIKGLDTLLTGQIHQSEGLEQSGPVCSSTLQYTSQPANSIKSQLNTSASSAPVSALYIPTPATKPIGASEFQTQVNTSINKYVTGISAAPSSVMTKTNTSTRSVEQPLMMTGNGDVDTTRYHGGMNMTRCHGDMDMTRCHGNVSHVEVNQCERTYSAWDITSTRVYGSETMELTRNLDASRHAYSYQGDQTRVFSEDLTTGMEFTQCVSVHPVGQSQPSHSSLVAEQTLDHTQIFDGKTEGCMDFTVCHSELVNPVHVTQITESPQEECKIDGISFLQRLMGGDTTSSQKTVLFDTPEKKSSTSVMIDTPDKINGKSFLSTLMSCQSDHNNIVDNAAGKMPSIGLNIPDKVEDKQLPYKWFGGQNEQETIKCKEVTPTGKSLPKPLMFREGYTVEESQAAEKNDHRVFLDPNVERNRTLSGGSDTMELTMCLHTDHPAQPPPESTNLGVAPTPLMEANMLTCALPKTIQQNTQSSEQSNQPLQRSTDVISSTQSANKTVLFNKDSEMEFTCELSKHLQEKPKATQSLVGNKTVLFNKESEMEFTCELSKHLQEKPEVTQSLVGNKTVLFNKESEMEFTCELSKHLQEKPEVTQSLMGNKTVLFNKESEMECTCELPQHPQEKPGTPQHMAGNKTILFNDETNMEFTCKTFPIVQVPPIRKSLTMAVDENMTFDNEANMEFTCVVDNVSGARTLNSTTGINKSSEQEEVDLVSHNAVSVDISHSALPVQDFLSKKNLSENPISHNPLPDDSIFHNAELLDSSDDENDMTKTVSKEMILQKVFPASFTGSDFMPSSSFIRSNLKPASSFTGSDLKLVQSDTSHTDSQCLHPTDPSSPEPLVPPAESKHIQSETMECSTISVKPIQSNQDKHRNNSTVNKTVMFDMMSADMDITEIKLPTAEMPKDSVLTSNNITEETLGDNNSDDAKELSRIQPLHLQTSTFKGEAAVGNKTMIFGGSTSCDMELTTVQSTLLKSSNIADSQSAAICSTDVFGKESSNMDFTNVMTSRIDELKVAAQSQSPNSTRLSSLRARLGRLPGGATSPSPQGVRASLARSVISRSEETVVFQDTAGDMEFTKVVSDVHAHTSPNFRYIAKESVIDAKLNVNQSTSEQPKDHKPLLGGTAEDEVPTGNTAMVNQYMAVDSSIIAEHSISASVANNSLLSQANAIDRSLFDQSRASQAMLERSESIEQVPEMSLHGDESKIEMPVFADISCMDLSKSGMLGGSLLCGVGDQSPTMELRDTKNVSLQPEFTAQLSSLELMPLEPLSDLPVLPMLLVPAPTGEVKSHDIDYQLANTESNKPECEEAITNLPRSTEGATEQDTMEHLMVPLDSSTTSNEDMVVNSSPVREDPIVPNAHSSSNGQDNTELLTNIQLPSMCLESFNSTHNSKRSTHSSSSSTDSVTSKNMDQGHDPDHDRLMAGSGCGMNRSNLCNSSLKMGNSNVLNRFGLDKSATMFIPDESDMVCGPVGGVQTVDDYLIMLGISIHLKSNRCSSIGCFSEPEPETLSDYLKLGLVEPEITMGTWVCKQLTTLIDKYKKMNGAQEENIKPKLPEMCKKTSANFNDHFARAQGLLTACRRKVQKSYKEWRMKILQRIDDTIQYEVSFLTVARKEITDRAEKVDQAINAVRQMSADLDDLSQQLMLQARAVKQVQISLKSEEADLRVQEEKLARCQDEEKILQEKHSQIKQFISKHPDTKNLEQTIEQRKEKINRILRCVCYNIESIEDNVVVISFLDKTLLLKLQLGDHLEETGNHSENWPPRTITGLVVESKIPVTTFENPLMEEIYTHKLMALGHEIVKKSLPVDNLREQCTDTNKLRMVFLRLSRVVLAVEHFMKYIRWPVAVKHRISYETNSLSIMFSSCDIPAKFQVTFVLDPCNFLMSAPRVTVKRILGRVQVEEVESLLSTISPGPDYVKMAVQRIHYDLLKTKNDVY